MSLIIGLLGIALLCAVDASLILLLRKNVLHFGFANMSRSSIQEIHKGKSLRERLLLRYTLNYEHGAQLVVNLVFYYLFSICSIILIFLAAISLFSMPPQVFQMLWSWLGSIVGITLFSSMATVLMSPKK